MAKLQAYSLQDQGLDTIEANHALGLKTDYRQFGLAVAILHHLRVKRVRLLSNNPRKARALIESGIEITELVSCEVPSNRYSLAYLQVQKHKLGHRLLLGAKK